MNGTGDTVIPPCPLAGHNWGGVACRVGMPWVAQSLFNPGTGKPICIDDGTRILRLSYHVEDMFRKVGGGWGLNSRSDACRAALRATARS